MQIPELLKTCKVSKIIEIFKCKLGIIEKQNI